MKERARLAALGKYADRPAVDPVAVAYCQGRRDAAHDVAALEWDHDTPTIVLDQAHAALRTVDCNILLDAAQSETALRVSNAIVAIEAFAHAHRITLTEFQGPREIYCGECTTPNICKYGKCSHPA